MSVRVALGAFVIATLATACGGAIDTTAGDDGPTASWGAMLTCDGGGAVVEVDRADARRLRLVVHDDEASREVRMHVTRAADDSGAIVVRGQARVPVDGAGTFDRFVDDSGRFDEVGSVAPMDLSGAKPRVVAEVRRGAVDEVTLAFQEVTTTRSCTGTIDERFCRGGEWVESQSIKLLASWSFRGCR